MQELYSVSPALFMKVERIGESIHRKFQGRVSLLEYITLPEMGQHVVLRFDLREKVSGLNEIDAIENKLSQWVGEDFWAVLVGETYRRVEPPLPWATLSTGLEKFSQVVVHEPVPVASTPFASEIEKDAQIIRAHIPLSPDDWVWEVEVPLRAGSSLPIIRIVSKSPRDEQVVTIDEREFVVEYVPDNATYEGLVKAYPLARAAGKAVGHYILEHSRNV